jgi:hypothetical protein
MTLFASYKHFGLAYLDQRAGRKENNIKGEAPSIIINPIHRGLLSVASMNILDVSEQSSDEDV